MVAIRFDLMSLSRTRPCWVRVWLNPRVSNGKFKVQDSTQFDSIAIWTHDNTQNFKPHRWLALRSTVTLLFTSYKAYWNPQEHICHMLLLLVQNWFGGFSKRCSVDYDSRMFDEVLTVSRWTERRFCTMDQCPHSLHLTYLIHRIVNRDIKKFEQKIIVFLEY